MPFFVRTRQLDLRRLERKPQENLQVVHTILHGSIKDVLDKLKKVERAYYGIGKGVNQEIQKWLVPIQAVMASLHISHLLGSWQVDELIVRAQDPEMKLAVDVYDLNKLKECYRKAKDFVPQKFTDLIINLKTVLKYLQKYCLSFFDRENDPRLETAVHYDDLIQKFTKAIREKLNGITQLADKFSTSELVIADFGTHCRELARKHNATQIPFLFLFTDACENIRDAAQSMMTWLDEDTNYALFLSNDVKELEKKKDKLQKSLRDHQQKWHQLHYRLKQAQNEYESMEENIEKLQSKEDELLVEEEFFSNDSNDMQLEIEIKEYRRDELLKNISSLHREVFHEKYAEVTEDLGDLKRKLPHIQRQLANVKYKLDWISGKKEALVMQRSKLMNLDKNKGEVHHSKLKVEEEFTETESLLELARRLHLYKTSSDAMGKIYHEQTVEVNHSRLPGHKQKEDPFARACQVVALHIEGDWIRLYRALPFHPPRGTTTIDKDINDIPKQAARQGMDVMVTRVLDRWRRHHVRAKLEDIKQALTDIRRYDVLRKIDMELNPPHERTEEEGDAELEALYGAELLPFLKMVEKFDQLRAANKI